jgi:hypothetical protein
MTAAPFCTSPLLVAVGCAGGVVEQAASIAATHIDHDECFIVSV